MSSGKKFLIVGAGLFGSVLAERLASAGAAHVLVLDRRPHVGGNCWSEIDPETGVEVHTYGSHIFHTSDGEAWEYVNRFTPFNEYRHTVWTTSRGKVYPLPVNLATINSFYGAAHSPEEAEQFIAGEAARSAVRIPANLEEKAVSMVGEALYNAFFRGYTLKQWEKDPRELSPDIITRLPVRFNYNTRYFSDLHEGIPLCGYGALAARILDHPAIEVRLGVDFADFKHCAEMADFDTVVYSGAIDEFFAYRLGALEWRSVDFTVERFATPDVLGTAVMNFADEGVPYTRKHEFKHYHPERPCTGKSIVFTEYSRAAGMHGEPFYPMDTEKNRSLLAAYNELAAREAGGVVFGGRLGSYKYYDMDDVIIAALACFRTIDN